MIYESERNFRIWDYNISHKQMLMRSPMAPGVAENIDIFLWGVEYLDLPTGLDGLSIASATAEEATQIAQLLPSRIRLPRVFCFESNGHRFLVAAWGFKVLQNQLDIFQSSLEYFAGTDPQLDRGKVIAQSDRTPIVVGA